MGKPLTDDWREWLRSNRARGCALDDLFQRATRQGFDPDAIAVELDGYRPAATPSEPVPAEPSAGDSVQPWHGFYHASLTDPAHAPRAWRVDTALAQVYEIPELLDREECTALMKVIDSSLKPSTVTRGPSDYRTSRTCHMRSADPAFMRTIDQRLAALIGVDPAFSEPIQGQRYDVGQYFKAHTDWFAPNTEEYQVHTRPGGQRTWTLMIYLNQVEDGGGTRFERLGRTFHPIPGLGVAWNNCGIDGTPNPYTVHEALPVVRGSKYVITKWFREGTGRND